MIGGTDKILLKWSHSSVETKHTRILERCPTKLYKFHNFALRNISIIFTAKRWININQQKKKKNSSYGWWRKYLTNYGTGLIMAGGLSNLTCGLNTCYFFSGINNTIINKIASYLTE